MMVVVNAENRRLSRFVSAGYQYRLQETRLWT